MIKKVEMKNFRQHKDLTLDLSSGVTVLRGANEAGKSTVFEAITFAMFGVRACRNNDITTWGEAENSHSVTVTFDVSGKLYVVRRSPRGAECTSEGVRVTGQSEVTRYCEELLQLKPGTGNKLMFVGQGSVRGILEDTGSRTTQMIEQLADFDQLDKWIENLQEMYPTGSTKFLDTIEETHKLELQKAEKQLSDLPDIDKVEEQENFKYRQSINKLEREKDGLAFKVKSLEDKQTQLLQEVEERNSVQRRLDKTKAEANSLLKSLSKELDDVPTARELQVCEELLTSKRQQAVVFSDYRSLQGTPFDVAVAHSERVEGSLSGLKEDLENLKAEARQANEASIDKRSRIKQLQKDLENQTEHCPTCGAKWKDYEQRQVHILETKHKIRSLEASLQINQVVFEESSKRYKDLEQLLNTKLPNLFPESQWILVEDGKYPPMYQWVGGEVQEVEPSEVKALERKVERMKVLIEQHEKYSVQREADAKQLEVLNVQIETLTKQLESLPESGKLSDVRQELQDVWRELNDVSSRLSAEQTKLNQLPDYIASLRNSRRAAEDEVKRHEDRLKEVSEQRKLMNDSNSLLRILRTAKPQLADQLWRTVCSAVTNYFSMMRGEQSSVSKGTEGFTVDGKSVTSLSGSTLDILGIAIRVALTKTFMPSCRFLFLDEPFAACDAQRQAQALGFITSAGFDQVVVVTHEDVSESIADNLLEI